jgi:peptidoglycan/LPS O-acetylase OafA/YrhL
MSAQVAPETDLRLLPSGNEAGTAPDDRRFRPDVEGLRALAVLLVVLFHAGLPHLTGGYIGVDVFFVISGFVITGLLLRERQGTARTSILNFYARRVRRILPAATLVIGAAVLATYIVLGILSGDSTANDGRWAAAFLANFHFESVGTDYLTASLPPSPLQNYWSLSVEEQFYVVYPTLFLGVASLRSRLDLRARLAMVLSMIIVASYWFSIVQTSSHPSAAFFSPFTRAWELALGALVAVGTSWLRKVPTATAATLTWIGMAAIVYSAFAFTSQTAYPGSLVAVPVVGAALIIAGGAALPRCGAESVLGPRPVQWLGRRSYSLYLWHWPILILAAERVGQSRLTFRENLPLLVVAVLLSAMSYRIVEHPLRHVQAPPRQTVVAGAALVLATVVTLTLAITLETTKSSKEQVAPSPDQAALIHQVAIAPRITTVPDDLLPSLGNTVHDFAGFNRPEFSCERNAVGGMDRSRACTFGDPHGRHILVLYGDSHALMWLPAFAEIADQAHWRLVVVASFYCPAELVTVGNPAQFGPPGTPNSQCEQFHARAIPLINSLRPDMIVISQSSLYGSAATKTTSAGPFSPTDWASGLTDLLGSIKIAPERKVFLGDTPLLPTDPSSCLSAHGGDVQACSSPVNTTASGLMPVEQKTVTAAGARYIDPTPWFCSHICTAIVDHYGVYRDRFHMTGTYALYLERVLGAALDLPSA